MSRQSLVQRNCCMLLERSPSQLQQLYDAYCALKHRRNEPVRSLLDFTCYLTLAISPLLALKHMKLAFAMMKSHEEATAVR